MKTFFIVVVSALFVQNISGQCLGYNAAPETSLYSAGYGCGNGLGNGLNLANFNSPLNNGGALNLGSSSPFGPIGLTIVSENEIGGSLVVEGQLPFSAVVALEGQVPSTGSGGVSYSCGDGEVGIVSQGQPGGLSYGAGLGSSLGGGYSTGLGGSPFSGVSYGYGCSR